MGQMSIHLGQILNIVDLTFQNTAYTLYAFEKNLPVTFQPYDIFAKKAVFC